MSAAPQQVRFCRSEDGVRIAYARHGSGPPLVLASCWLSHLQYDWESPVWQHWMTGLGAFADVLRYDERGNGLSDWDVKDFSFERRVQDLEAVVDAAGLERFALLGMAQGGQVAIAYAARHPERVSRLVMYNARAVFPDGDDDLEQAYVQMIRVGWARPESEFRRVFTSMMIPGASEQQMTWLDELQRMSTSTTNAIEQRACRRGLDVSDLAATLRLPALVMHAKDERLATFAEAVELAGLVPGARLVPLESSNHIMLADEPAWPVFLDELRRFVEQDAGPRRRPSAAVGTLTARERDVLRLAAQGQDNDGIARELTLSTRTVERHLQNAYLKLGVAGRTARAAAVAAILSA